jgi:hypothetical protein
LKKLKSQRGFDYLEKVIEGKQFKGEIEVILQIKIAA